MSCWTHSETCGCTAEWQKSVYSDPPGCSYSPNPSFQKRDLSLLACQVFSSSSKDTWSTLSSVKSVLWNITRMLKIVYINQPGSDQIQSKENRVDWSKRWLFFSSKWIFFPWSTKSTWISRYAASPAASCVFTSAAALYFSSYFLANDSTWSSKLL